MAGNMDEPLFSPKDSDASTSLSAIIRFKTPKPKKKQPPNNDCIYFTILEKQLNIFIYYSRY